MENWSDHDIEQANHYLEQDRRRIEEDHRRVEEAFTKTAEACAQALDEVVQQTIEVTPDFWNSFYEALSELSAYQQEAVIARAEAVSAERIAEENRAFEASLPKLRRQAFMRGVMSIFGPPLDK